MDIEVLLGWMWEQTSRLRKEGGRECGADNGDRYVVLLIRISVDGVYPRR